MKKSHLFANCVFAISFLLIAISFIDCSAGDADDVTWVDGSLTEKPEAPFSVYLKAIDSDGIDITAKGEVSGAALFVFDQDGNFVKQINVDKSSILNRKEITIGCPANKGITIIAWGGVSSGNEEISTMSQVNIISDLQLRLKNTNGVALLPDDLFYGQVTVQKNDTKANSSNRLTITRKTAVFHLTTKGLITYMGNTKGEYIYRIKKTKNTFDYNGEMTGEEVEYAIPASFDKKGNLVATSITILPSPLVTIELYKDGNLLYSCQNDQSGKTLSAKAGKQFDIVFKYSKTTSADVVIADWNTIIKDITIN